MTKKDVRAKSPSQRRSGLVRGILIAVVLLGVPALVLYYQARHSGLTGGEMLAHIFKPARDAPEVAAIPEKARQGSKIDFLTPVQIGFPGSESPRIASLSIADLDRDGLQDVLVTDMLANKIGWIRQDAAGGYAEKWISVVLPAPARVDACDIDKDGDLDILVAVMGQLFPSNDKIGSVVILENDGKQNFKARTIMDRIARVTDVRGADLDGDGDIDMIVGQFGYDDGETRWLENLGNWQFRSHILQSLSGPIHTIPADIDGDGDLDVVSLVSQEWEEIYFFENEGHGKFNSHLIWGSTNEDYGSSGMRVLDMDRDGDLDILFTNGDAFDYLPPRPRPWHGVQWLENKGGRKFEFHQIGKFNGASAAVGGDVDGDGDVDVVAVSCYNFWEKPEAQSMIWFENEGKMAFTARDIAHSPTHLIQLEAADMNRDGKVDFVSGRMNVYAPFTKAGRIMLWLNHWGAPSSPLPR